MKVTELRAMDVHGYLGLKVKFNADLTFITGLNGSGKTTAIELLVALLTPSPEKFAATSFSSASVSAVEGENEVVISASKRPDGVELSINTIAETLHLSSSDLQLMIESRKRDDHRGLRDEAFSPIQQKIEKNPTYQAIREISTPMFLGVDRRLSADWFRDNLAELRRRDYFMRRISRDEELTKGINYGLADVNYLVSERMQEIRAAQERLDEELRKKFFTRAFEYKPGDFRKGSKLPSREELERYKQSLNIIERAAEGLRLPVPELKAALSEFLERMTEVVNALGATAGKQKGRGRQKETVTADDNFLQWVINKPQSDRIIEHLELLDAYVSDREALHAPINRFVTLINGFLAQTKKVVSVASTGELEVFHGVTTEPRSISALSSGERQLIIILGHLALNPNLEKSAVFIVDEPEISLHVAWQERFVDAVIEANPNVQYILATHSPAIILDRIENCSELN
ncbi:hypothetical protein XarbCFBP7697_18955 [Xanthomonas arboricola]|uniref:AAA family ATPase n=1 Tax=Xanthomonas arboricola TaxID=56448 RepID=UPI000CEE85AD|nr:AAA family ATPase [Xanthomonas arboricola]PPU47612.1 hypothetical protein XarbCFBP7697_18955 [Xanthomonas arboricola]